MYPCPRIICPIVLEHNGIDLLEFKYKQMIETGEEMKTLRDLFEECRENYKLRLFAGRSGLSHEVKWVCQSEDRNAFSFLRGGELIITTGITYDGTYEWFERLLDELIRNRASGLIVNTGIYIQTANVTSEVKRLFDDASMPLLLMSREVHIGDFMQEISSQIFRQGQEQDVINNLFTDMLLDSPVRTEQALKLESYGFRNDARYNVLCVSELSSYAEIKRFLTAADLSFHILHSYGKVVVIFQSPDDETALSLADAILADSGMKRGENASKDKPVIGMGEAEYALSRVKFTYQNAVNALRVAQRHNVNFARFSELGFYQVLLSIEDTDLLMRLRREYLGVLDEYDKTSSSCLKDTLRLYLRTGGRPADVADMMFTHRNTINYRMRKIRELLPYDIDDPDHLFMLKMAFYINDDL